MFSYQRFHIELTATANELSHPEFRAEEIPARVEGWRLPYGEEVVAAYLARMHEIGCHRDPAQLRRQLAGTLDLRQAMNGLMADLRGQFREVPFFFPHLEVWE